MYLYMHNILSNCVYPMDDDKNKGFEGSYTHKASPVRTGNLAHSIQTQLSDHVYRLSPRNVNHHILYISSDPFSFYINMKLGEQIQVYHVHNVLLHFRIVYLLQPMDTLLYNIWNLIVYPKLKQLF